MKRPHSRLLLSIFLLLPVYLQVFGSQEIPAPPNRWVTDKAGFLSSETVADLNQRLETFERKTGHQVIVYIDRNTQGMPIEEWAVRAFEAWGIGKKGNDDGLALFIMVDDRKLRIEVGYGLEHIVPDATASRIINEILVPHLRDGNEEEGVRLAVAKLLEIIEELTQPDTPGSVREREKVPIGTLILFGIAGLFFFFLLITNPRLALYLLFSIMSSGGGRSGGGGGIFRGGGGRSGGGGASGSW